jgi:hypothetical protein
MSTRTTTLRALVVQADPEHTKESRYVIEYRFTSPGRAVGNQQVQEAGQRVFRGDYQTRGPYAD